MKVILAGYNLDHEIIDQIRRSLSGPETGAPAIDPAALTPETLSAAYARISRDPKPIPALRAASVSDVAAARRSNQRIVFGFGHASVAEHAVFNLDVLGISRLAMEALEMTRLGSYTEKSQRYILLDRDYVVPAEIAGTALEVPYRDLLARQQAGYREAYERLRDHSRATDPQAWQSKQGQREREGAAKEDARYFLGLGTTGQVGVTLNARSLEATARRLAAEPLDEARRLGAELHEAVARIAPSVVCYTEATPYRRETPAALGRMLRETAARLPAAGNSASPAPQPVRLVETAGDDTLLLTALLQGCGDASWAEARALAERLDTDARLALVTESLRRINPHETPLRQFELPEFTFELILSASCFAQLKRHRIATLLCQPYAPPHGVTIPPSFAPVDLTPAFEHVRQLAEEVYGKIAAVHPHAAAYALTNAHRRRVIFKINARALYHFSRLRLDSHAQWDIRGVATEMVRQARQRMPLTMLLAAGKDQFAQLHAQVTEDSPFLRNTPTIG